MNHKLPGELVVCRSDVEHLILWESCECDAEDVNGLAEAHEILIVLDYKKTSGSDKIMDEWSEGAYKLMTPRGVVGWTGVGWVVSLDH